MLRQLSELILASESGVALAQVKLRNNCTSIPPIVWLFFLKPQWPKCMEVFKTSYLLGRVPWKGVCADPVRDLAAELHDFRVAVAVANMFHEQLEFSGALLTLFLGSCPDCLVQSDSNGDGAVNNIGNPHKIIFRKTSAGHGRCAHSEPPRNKGRAVARDGVLVGSDTDEFEDALHTAAIDAMGLKVSEDQVVVGTSADKAVP